MLVGFRRCWVWMLMGLPVPAWAAPSVVTLHTHFDYVVQRDGTWSMTGEIVRQLNDRIAISTAGQATIPYTSLQSLQVLAAWTQTPAGRRVPVAATGILTQQPQPAAAATFDGTRTKVIVFPALSPGAIITYRYRLAQKTPLFPGAVALALHFPPFFAWRDVRVRLTAPAGAPLFMAAQGLNGGRLPDRGGLAHWQWQLDAPATLAAEPDTPAAVGFGPRLVISSFANATALGNAYLARERDKTRVTPAIRAMADRITRGLVRPADQARALYDWVSGNIRYVALLFGNGGVVPHTADAVLRNRYGDCKDHSVLLEALLRARGIASSPVLINLSPTWRASPLVTSTDYDHVITWLPRFHLFVDSTAQYAPFGTLPFADEDKPVLIAAEGRLTRTPMATHNYIDQSTLMQINPDGSLDGETRLQTDGDLAPRLRRTVAALMNAPQPAAMLQGGSARILRANPDNLDARFLTDARFHLNAIVNLPDPGALPMPDGVDFFPIAAQAAAPGFTPRRLPWVCPDVDLSQSLLLRFPDNLTVTNIPAGQHVRVGPLAYDSTYTLRDNMLAVTRHYVLAAGPLCTAALANASREARARILHDLHARILYR